MNPKNFDICIESSLPVVQQNGLNTNKNVVFTGITSVNGISSSAPIITDYSATAAINSTGTATAAQIATGYITSTSGAATTITLPTGTLLGAQLGATQGMIFDFFVDNTAGANTVTIAVATNGVLSDAAVTSGAVAFGDLTIASGVTGLARFTIMFSSPTAYVFSRTA